MTTKVQKWGNSLGVHLPKEVTEKIGINQGTEVTFKPTKNGVLLEPKTAEPTLADLLNKITPENRHDEIDFGREGNELL